VEEEQRMANLSGGSPGCIDSTVLRVDRADGRSVARNRGVVNAASGSPRTAAASAPLAFPAWRSEPPEASRRLASSESYDAENEGTVELLAPLRRLTDDLWVAERPQSFYGLPVGARMTVIRLRDGRLLLHSPVSLDPALRDALDALGHVAFAVAPNRLHHLHAGNVRRCYPGARLWIAPGLDRKRPDLAFEAVLDDEAPEAWRGELDQAFFGGRPYENEVAFFHRASRTLILCDLAFNFGPNDATPTRVLMKLLRSYGRLGPTKLDPLLIRDRRAARGSLERILAWDFDRVIVAHGDVQESGGKALLRDGYAWLLRS
jgi:hypothetical protein